MSCFTADPSGPKDLLPPEAARVMSLTAACDVAHLPPLPPATPLEGDTVVTGGSAPGSAAGGDGGPTFSSTTTIRQVQKKLRAICTV